MKTGNNPKDWGDFVYPKGSIKSKIFNKIIKMIIETTLKDPIK